MTRVKDLAGLAVLTIGTVAAVVGLHRLGSLPWLQVPTDRLGTWLATAATADVVASVLRLIALGCAYWLLAGTVLYTLARLSRVPAAVSAVRWTTLPPVRGVVDRAVTMTLAVSAAVGGGAAAAADQATPPPPPPVVSDDVPEVMAPPGPPLPYYVPVPAGDAPPSAGPAGVAQPPAGVAQPPAGVAQPQSGCGRSDGAGTHLVEAGDTLWDIAAQRVAHVAGRSRAELSARDISSYWVRVVATNRATLRSGDPDVIHPGERIQLPPLGQQQQP